MNPGSYFNFHTHVLKNCKMPNLAERSFFVRQSPRFQSPEIHIKFPSDSCNCSRLKSASHVAQSQKRGLVLVDCIETSTAVCTNDALHELHHAVRISKKIVLTKASIQLAPQKASAEIRIFALHHGLDLTVVGRYCLSLQSPSSPGDNA